MRATFRGGYTIAFYKADATTGDAQEIWHNQRNDAANEVKPPESLHNGVSFLPLTYEMVVHQFALGLRFQALLPQQLFP